MATFDQDIINRLDSALSSAGDVQRDKLDCVYADGVRLFGDLPRGDYEVGASSLFPRKADGDYEEDFLGLLEQSWRGKDAEVRQAVILALGVWGGEKSAAALRSVVGDILQVSSPAKKRPNVSLRTAESNYVLALQTNSMPDRDLVPVPMLLACLNSLAKIGGHGTHTLLKSIASREELGRTVCDAGRRWLRELETGGTIDASEGVTVQSYRVELVEGLRHHPVFGERYTPDPVPDGQYSLARTAWEYMRVMYFDLTRLTWNAGLLQHEFATETDPCDYEKKYKGFLDDYLAEWKRLVSEWESKTAFVVTALRSYEDRTNRRALYKRDRQLDFLLNCLEFFFDAAPSTIVRSHLQDLGELSAELKGSGSSPVAATRSGRVAARQSGPKNTSAKQAVDAIFKKIGAELRPMASELNRLVNKWLGRFQSAAQRLPPVPAGQAATNTQVELIDPIELESNEKIKSAISKLLPELQSFSRDLTVRKSRRKSPDKDAKKRLESFCQSTLELAQLFAKPKFPQASLFKGAAEVFVTFSAILSGLDPDKAIQVFVEHASDRKKEVESRGNELAVATQVFKELQPA